MNQPIEDKWWHKRRERAERRESTKLSARTLTAVVFALTMLFWVRGLAQPNPTAVSFLDQFWTGVAIFCPLIAVLLTVVLFFGYMRTDPTSEIWAYVAAFLTFSMFFLDLVHPREFPPPGSGNP
jgi:fumarate reductase subunit C